jgi:hypothetical protein
MSSPPTKATTGRLHRLLRDDKIPFLLATLLAALAWCVNHVADRAKELPIIEYKAVHLSVLPEVAEKYRLCPASKALHAYVFEVRNISAQRAFKNLNLYFWSWSDAPITEARWINQPPGIAEQVGSPCNPNSRSRAISLQLKELQWDWSGLALVWTKDPVRPAMMYRDLSYADAPNADPSKDNSASKEQAVLLRRADFTTWIIRNEFEIYYVAIGILALLMIFYLVTYAFGK